ncbi:MAG: amidohydrolase family protein, partial [Chloroflexales bacterium]|nr:amidohydrolase family protein [Chloroflexales bacterium]
PLIAAATAGFVARRFRLPQKGALAVGYDADIALVDLAQSEVVRADALHYRHRHSPYVGRTLQGRIVRTVLRGQTIYRDGQFVAAPAGRLLTPQA